MAVQTGAASIERRAFLGAVFGATSAFIVQSIGRPLAVHADNDDHLLAGHVVTASTTTGVTTTSANGLQGISSDGNASGVFGQNTGGGPGVAGNCTNGNAVTGASTNGIGVVGVSVSAYGVQGVATGLKAGVLGKTRTNRTGLLGWCAIDDGESEPTAPSNTGVYGYAKSGGSAGRGVTGETAAGRGVSGIATTGVGVHGKSTSGMAIEAKGRVQFSTSGLTTVPASATLVQVNPGVDIVATSRILSTLESNQNGLAIQRLVKNPAANTFTVVLTGPVAVGKIARVAWFVIG